MKYYMIKRKSTGLETITPPPINANYWGTRENKRIEVKTKKSLSGQYLPIYIGKQILINVDAYNVIRKYQMGQQFMYCAFLEQTTGIQRIYLWFNPFKLDCLHETTQRHPDRTIKKMVLDREKIGFHKVFLPEDIFEPYLIVDLEILEKLLCAGVYPIEWEEVECV